MLRTFDRGHPQPLIEQGAAHLEILCEHVETQLGCGAHILLTWPFTGQATV